MKFLLFSFLLILCSCTVYTITDNYRYNRYDNHHRYQRNYYYYYPYTQLTPTWKIMPQCPPEHLWERNYEYWGPRNPKRR